MVEKIVLASPRGFCAGVDRAIEIVERALEVYGEPVYVRHEIVHNELVVNTLKEKGAIFIEELDEVPTNSPVVFSAHGIPPSVIEDAKERELNYIDATCPLVTKVHVQAQKYEREEYSLILIGHKGHQEVLGTMGHASMQLVENPEDVAILEVENLDKVAYLTQTTLSMDDTKEVVNALKDKFPSIKSSEKEDICYATQNRQNAVKELAKEADYILVIGSTKSSNSKRLVETSKRHGIESILIPDESMINQELLTGIDTLGMTSGASVPEVLVNKAIKKVQSFYPQTKISHLVYTEENVNFILPKELR